MAGVRQVGRAVAVVMGVWVAGAAIGPASADPVSVSVTGDAHNPSGNGPAVSGTGCATSDYGLLAVSGTGCADSAVVAVSGTGPAGYRNPTCSYACGGDLSISGTGCARSYTVAVGGQCSEGELAVSVLGDANAYDRLDVPYVGADPGTPGTAVSVFGNARGPVAVSVFGNADARPSTYYLPTGPTTVDGVAVSVFGEATDQ